MSERLMGGQNTGSQRNVDGRRKPQETHVEVEPVCVRARACMLYLDREKKLRGRSQKKNKKKKKKQRTFALSNQKHEKKKLSPPV